MAKKKGCPVGFTLSKKGNMCYKKIKSIDDIKELSVKGFTEYVLLLGPKGMVRSSKVISYNTNPRARKPYWVWHAISDHEELLNRGQLKNEFGEAIKKGAFWCETPVR